MDMDSSNTSCGQIGTLPFVLPHVLLLQLLHRNCTSYEALIFPLVQSFRPSQDLSCALAPGLVRCATEILEVASTLKGCNSQHGHAQLQVQVPANALYADEIA